MEWKIRKEKIWKENIKTENKYLDDKVINNRIQSHWHVEREKETKKRKNEGTNDWMNKYDERMAE